MNRKAFKDRRVLLKRLKSKTNMMRPHLLKITKKRNLINKKKKSLIKKNKHLNKKSKFSRKNGKKSKRYR